jgi:transcriptional regulator with XRE-family HTH domain
MIRFDSKALFAALDEQRRTRRLTWTQVAKETGVAAATLKRTEQGGRLEVDGVLAMVGWLGRTVESFTKGSRF